jgi:hypothetical protein
MKIQNCGQCPYYVKGDCMHDDASTAVMGEGVHYYGRDLHGNRVQYTEPHRVPHVQPNGPVGIPPNCPMLGRNLVLEWRAPEVT